MILPLPALSRHRILPAVWAKSSDLQEAVGVRQTVVFRTRRTPPAAFNLRLGGYAPCAGEGLRETASLWPPSTTPGHLLGRSGRWIAVTVEEFALQAAIDALGVGELIFQDHDPARRVEDAACIDQFAASMTT
ncbi:hypothetical protein [Nocardia fluminea]|uniref:hypothetical protein n=1 Tax=Nocardia fluminea TaxID=134984 RepID=UPI00343EF2A1